MRSVSIEHNLMEHELEEVLDKALRGVKQSREESRDFNDPFMADRAERLKRIYQKQTSKMLDRIQKLLAPYDPLSGGALCLQRQR